MMRFFNMNVKLLFSIVVLFTWSSLDSIAQNKIEIRDTVINRAILNEIPVYGRLENLDSGMLEICIQFDARVIDIKQTKLKNNCILKDVYSFETNFNKYSDAVVKIKSDNFNKNSEGILFYLIVEGLAGSDTANTLKVDCFNLNESPIANPTLINGKISVNSTPITQKFSENIGLNKPNPFEYETIVPFTIDNDTQVDFKIFSLNGNKVLGSLELEDGFELEVFNEHGNLIEDPANHIFKQGYYTTKLRALNWNVATGAYYLVMKTNSGSYKINILLVK